MSLLLEQWQRGGFAESAQFLSALPRERSDIFACLDGDRESLVFFSRRSCKTARRLSAIEGRRVEGDCARRKRCGGALLPWRSETNPGLGSDGGGCGIKPRAAARSQLGTRSPFPFATAALPRRAERRARACPESRKIGSALTDY